MTSTIAVGVHSLGFLAQAAGDHQEAQRSYRESIAITEELGDTRGMAGSLHQLGRVAQENGDYREAHRLYLESLKIAEELQDTSGVAAILGQLGVLAEDDGRLEDAVRLWAEAAAIFRELGSAEVQVVLQWPEEAKEELGEELFQKILDGEDIL